jgi:hypothetical protein
MGTSKDILNDEIYELEQEVKELKEINEFYLQKSQNEAELLNEIKILKEAHKEKDKQTEHEDRYVYIHEIISIWEDHEEIYFETENNTIVVNPETFFTDLPIIMDLCLKARKSHKKRVLEQIKEQLKTEKIK